MNQKYQIRMIEDSDREWIRDILRESWGSNYVVTRGVVHQADELPGLIAEFESKRVGLLTYNVDNELLEIITLNVLVQSKGIGKTLVNRVIDIAELNQCSRVWVITTNDNTPAIRFYKAVGFKIRKIWKGAIDDARKLKPEIPLVGIGDVPIKDEVELEKILSSR